MKIFLYIYIVIVGLFFSCEEVVVIDLDQSQPQVVIEGLLTNKDTVHFVKVSQSIQFYETGLNPITNAVISVKGGGEEYLYSHNPMGLDSMDGFYFSDVAFAGQIGETYTLNVEVGEANFSATDTMLYVTTIDSLSFQLALDPTEEDAMDGKIYELLLYAAEPQETDDYYQFHFLRDNELVAYLNNIYVFSDVALGPTLNGLPSPVLYREGEVAKVQILSLTREQYVFYNDLSNILNSDGGMFSPTPANPRNTFSNNALGLWQVSAVSEDSIKIIP